MIDKGSCAFGGVHYSVRRKMEEVPAWSVRDATLRYKYNSSL